MGWFHHQTWHSIFAFECWLITVAVFPFKLSWDLRPLTITVELGLIVLNGRVLGVWRVWLPKFLPHSTSMWTQIYPTKTSSHSPTKTSSHSPSKELGEYFVARRNWNGSGSSLPKALRSSREVPIGGGAPPGWRPSFPNWSYVRRLSFRTRL